LKYLLVEDRPPARRVQVRFPCLKCSGVQMSRLPRLELPQWPHLVVQAVAPGERLFVDEPDLALLKRALLESSRQHDVAVHAYVLLPGRLVLLATPAEKGGLSLFMQSVGRRYVTGYNRRYGRQGALWAGRFRASVLDAAQYLLEAMAYIELMPWREGLVALPDSVSPEAPSSLAYHLGRCADPLILDHGRFWAVGNTPFEREAAWRARLVQGQGPDMVRCLAEAAHKGWALGDAQALAKGQVLTERRLQPKPRGRPRKAPQVPESAAPAP
jgi:putative transposase